MDPVLSLPSGSALHVLPVLYLLCPLDSLSCLLTEPHVSIPRTPGLQQEWICNWSHVKQIYRTCSTSKDELENFAHFLNIFIFTATSIYSKRLTFLKNIPFWEMEQNKILKICIWCGRHKWSHQCWQLYIFQNCEVLVSSPFFWCLKLTLIKIN